MKHLFRPFVLAALTGILFLGAYSAAHAAVPGQAGPYKVELSTEPPVIPVGKVRLTIRVTDSMGMPVEGATVHALVKMATMSMGEKETAAAPVSGQPGIYQTDASFMMEGAYDATLTISGSQGTGTGRIPLQTGQNTGAGSAGFSVVTLLQWLVVLVAVAFLMYRLRVTGQRLNVRGLASRGSIGGLILLASMLAGSVYAVNHWRRPGAMTPIQAQAMEMNTPAPPGTAAVMLAPVTRGPIQRTIRYTGQAVGYNEQDVIARTQGWLTWMPLYVGDHVRAGQIIGRLDTSQVQPQIAERQAALLMAQRAVSVVRQEYRETQAMVHQAHGEEAIRQAAISEAEANQEAARQDRSAADSDLAAAQTRIADAQAQIDSAKADQSYWQQEIGREKALLAKGAVSRDEYQKEMDQAAGADAKVQQAQAALAQAQAQVRSAQSAQRKADAMIAAASNKVHEVQAELFSHTSHVDAAQAAVGTARAKIEEAEAGVAQARGGLQSVSTTRGYSEVRTLIDGVVTQRLISPGSLVNPGQSILRVAQISPIRLQANVAQDDLDSVQVGSRVVVRRQSGSGEPIEARVTSITPSVDPVARTGIVEAVVPNKDGRILPGQFVVMDISTGGSRSALRIPVQAIRTRPGTANGLLAGEPASYVWVATPAPGQDGQYTVKQVDVQTGISDGTYTEVVSGLENGQQVVTMGADYLKVGDSVTGKTGEHEEAAATEAIVEVSADGFTPGNVTVKAGVPVKLTFIRKDDVTCGKEVVIPDYGIRKALPLNQPVTIEFTPRKGEFGFTCGMGMLRGRVVAQ